MPNANLSLQILPMVPQDQVYSVADKVINLIQASGLPYVAGPMETTIEGDPDNLLKARQACVEAGANRIVSIIKIDYSPDGVTIDEKISNYR